MPDDESTPPQETPPEQPTNEAPLQIDGYEVELAPDAEAPEALQPADEQPPAPTETPPAPVPPVEQPPENKDDLPSWLAEIPAAERAGVAERILSGLSPEERAALPTVSQLVNQAAAWSAEQTQAQITDASNDETRHTQLEQSATALYDDIVASNLSAEQLQERLGDYAEHNADVRQAELNDDIQEAIWAGARALGLKQLPANVVSAAANADGWGGALQVYQHYMLQTAYGAGIEYQKTQGESSTKADAAADRARLTDEIKADLIKEGWRQPGIPPALGETAAVSGGGLTPDEYKRRNEQGADVDHDQIDAMTRQYVSLG